MKNFRFLILAFLVVLSCKEDSKELPLLFSDENIVKNQNVVVDISYPKANGPEKIANKINTTVENFLANEINMSENPDKSLTLNDAITDFDNEFKSFKDDFADTTQQWEALIESDVSYESEALVCIAVNSYLDTGGAHGNSHVTFLNFDKKTGALLKRTDIIKNMDAFKKLVYPYFEKATQPLSDEDTIEDPFYGEGFQLPENIGFSDDGLILLYNVYEIASYAQGVTEFTIPYNEAQSFLKIDL